MKNLTRILLLLMAAMMLTSLPMMASPIACPSTGSVATLVALNPTGCLIDGLLFDNFVFNESVTGDGTAPTATQVTYTLDDPGTSTLTGQTIWGFEFNPNLSVVGIGSEDVSLDYTITAPSPIITSIHVLENAVTSGAATATVSETDFGCAVSPSSCVTLPADVVTPANPHQDLLGIGPFMQLDVFKDINVSSTSVTGIAGISQVRDSVDLSTAPEPSTYAFALAGAGMLGLAFRKRRWLSR